MINPDEIKTVKLKSGMRGYKKKAVNKLLEDLHKDYDILYKENIELKDKLSVLSEGVQYYKNMEKTLQKALVLAEKTTAETMSAAQAKADALEKASKSQAQTIENQAKLNADTRERESKIKADAIVKGARAKADALISASNEELNKLHNQMIALVQQYEKYKTQFKQLAASQIELLESESFHIEVSKLNTIPVALHNTKKAPFTEQQARKQDIPVLNNGQFFTPHHEGNQPPATLSEPAKKDTVRKEAPPKEEVTQENKQDFSKPKNFGEIHNENKTEPLNPSIGNINNRDATNDMPEKKRNVHSFSEATIEDDLFSNTPQKTAFQKSSHENELLESDISSETAQSNLKKTETQSKKNKSTVFRFENEGNL